MSPPTTLTSSLASSGGPPMSPPKALCFTSEFRLRSFYLLLSLLWTFFCSYFSADKILHLLALPLLYSSPSSTSHFSGFIFTDLSEAFSTYLLISFFTTSWFSIYILFFHFYFFVSPGLYPSEAFRLLSFFFLYLFFSLLNLFFLFLSFLPSICIFFLTFDSSHSFGLSLHLEPKIGSYSLFVLHFILFSHFLFQFPSFSFLFLSSHHLLLLPRTSLFCFLSLLSLFFAPPDLFSPFFLLIPLFFSYEFSLYSLFWASRRASLSYAYPPSKFL